MPLIQAWQCEDTKEIFADKTLYIAHLRTLAAVNLEAGRRAKIRTKLDAKFLEMRTTCATVREIELFITNNWSHFVQNHIESGYRYISRQTKFSDLEFVKIEIQRKMCVRNSHNCPLVDGVTNFTGEPDIPKHYPGYEGRIWWRAPPKNGEDTVFSGAFERTGLHTMGGSGNSFTGTGSLGLQLFDADWPLMADQWVNGEITKRLTLD